MNIDLTRLITNQIEELEIDEEICFSDNFFQDTLIRDLKDVRFLGEVTKLCDGDYQISGNLSGIMILPDDITLEDVLVKFNSEIEENFSEFSRSGEKTLEIVQNRLDITEFLWQNILVEIPSKVVSEKSKDLTLEGDGWRLVTEEELNECNKNPFSELSKMFDSRKE